jgi:hypothetical protein
MYLYAYQKRIGLSAGFAAKQRSTVLDRSCCMQPSILRAADVCITVMKRVCAGAVSAQLHIAHHAHAAFRRPSWAKHTRLMYAGAGARSPSFVRDSGAARTGQDGEEAAALHIGAVHAPAANSVTLFCLPPAAEADSRDQGLPSDSASEGCQVREDQEDRRSHKVQGPLQQVPVHPVCAGRRQG